MVMPETEREAFRKAMAVCWCIAGVLFILAVIGVTRLVEMLR